MATVDHSVSDSNSLVFAGTGSGDTLTQTGFTPYFITDNHDKTGYIYGAYLQDEWKLTPALTINYGARADTMNAFVTGSQLLSPRINTVYRCGAGHYITCRLCPLFHPTADGVGQPVPSLSVI